MSYNTRRSNQYGTPSSAVGQRRPPFSQPQGQSPSLQAGNAAYPRRMPFQQGNMKPQQQQFVPSSSPVQNNTPPTPVQTPQKLRAPLTPQQPSTPVQPPVTPAAPVIVKQQIQEPKIIFKNEDAPVVEPAETAPPVEMEVVEGDGKLKRVTFFRTTKGRISKKERLRKRNQRLRKILQPKNAPMVLNELIGCVQYSINESPPANFNAADDFSFKATVTVDEKEHVGFGKSKALAKSNAAEAAVKHLVLKKLSMGSNPISKNSSIASNASDAGEEDEKMEITTEDDDGGFSWSHVASFALHKLFNSWEDPNNKSNGLASQPASITKLVANPVSIMDQKPEHKPAKKMPDNAADMNPIMLLNQMRPLTTYEEISKDGTPPNVIFTFSCICDGQSFTGKGSSKKTARKHAAYQACRAVLAINYGKEVMDALINQV